MADFPNFDLLAEIEELSSIGDGKMTCVDHLDYPDVDLAADCGLPSLGMSEENVLAEALFGDPLLPLFDQKDITEPQPASRPSGHEPETLMQVSLPAGQPVLPPGPDSPDPPSDFTPRLSLTSLSREVESEDPVAAPRSFGDSHKPPTLTAPSTPAPAASTPISLPASPVRVVVRTSKMVAPVTVEKSARYLVRIPKASPPATHRQALHTLRGGGKLPPAPVSPAPPTPTRELPAPSPNASGNGSLLLPRVRRHSESSQGCAGQKRKVYEMEPQEDPNKERCRLNAINARRNRELKKAQMQELERRVEHVSKERDQLAGENESLREAKARLEHQVQHLNNILKNQSQLSALLSKPVTAAGTESAWQVGQAHP